MMKELDGKIGYLSKYIRIKFDKGSDGYDHYIELDIKVYNKDKELLHEELLEIDPENKESFRSKYGYDMVVINQIESDIDNV